jgi:uncharacterized protein YlbG (UPF0298 family)
MLSLEHRIYLIQCWTGFGHIFNVMKNFQTLYVSRMDVQKLIKKFLKTRSVTNLQKKISEDLPNM